MQSARRPRLLRASCTLALALLACDEGRLLPGGGSAGARFGASVAIDGQVRVVGAPDADGSVADAGSAYAFARSASGGLRTTRLVASDGMPFDDFGAAVAADGDLVVVGAPGHDAAGFLGGAAYVFRRDGAAWIEEEKLLPPVGWMGFGHVVAVSGDRIAVAAPSFYDGEVRKTGAGFFFRHEDGAWLRDGLVRTNDQTTQGDFFGRSIDIDGAIAVVGAATHARVYEWNGSFWVGTATLAPGSGSPVALEDDLLAIGAPNDTERGYGAGAAYAFRRSGGSWAEEGKLLWPFASSGYAFGASIAISGGVLAIGVPGATQRADAAQAGAIAVYRHDGAAWRGDLPFGAAGPGAGDRLGAAVALDGERAFGGAPGDDDAGEDAGAAYSFLARAPSRFRLAVRAYTDQGRHRAELRWVGANAAHIDVFRDGQRVATTSDGGAYLDAIERRGDASYAYRVCEAATSTCSNEVAVEIVDPS